MSEYRVRATGEIKSQGQIRKENSSISLPRVWNDKVHDRLGIDPVLAAPKPANTANYTVVVRNGAEQDSNGNWVYAWVERDMFTANSSVTKSEMEAEYQVGLDSIEAENVRDQRDRLLAETDYLALSDNTLTTEMTTYRQALRDITSHANFPNLDADDWPTKPE